jgi:hypothetical protein
VKCSTKEVTMNPSDLGDATARALNLLPPGDPASSDPRLARDSQLVEEAKRARETAAAVWLAVSPLRVAPPEVLQEVMREIRSAETRPPHTAHRSLSWLAASGWAAAAAVAIWLWPADQPPTNSLETFKNPADSPADIPAAVAPSATPPARDARLRKEIARLQDRIASLRDDPVRPTPRVMSLSAPGAIRRTEDESRQYLQRLLTDALRSALEASSGAPSDPASLVIERGWLPGGLPVPADGGMIRHRNFPEQDWQELGLSRTDERNYYDAASQTVWSPDPNGRGFIGRTISPEDDLANFTKEPERNTTPPKPEATPEGFVIESPVEKTTEIFVENLPEIPQGKQLVLQTTDAAGVITTTPLAPAAAGGIQAADPLVMNMNDIHPTWSGRATTLSSSGLITHSSGSLGTGGSAVNSSTAFSNLTNTASNTAYTSNIVGYLYGGSLIISFPSDVIPAEVQLAIGDRVPAGTPPKIILESEP